MALNEQHYQCMQLLLQGAARKDIATQLGISGNTVYAWQQNPEFSAELERLRNEAFDQVKSLVANGLREHVPTALATIVALSQASQSDKVKLSAAQDVLDRAGFGAVQKSHNIVEMKFPPGTLELAQQVMQEINARTITVVPQGVVPEEPVLLQ